MKPHTHPLCWQEGLVQWESKESKLTLLHLGQSRPRDTLQSSMNFMKTCCCCFLVCIVFKPADLFKKEKKNKKKKKSQKVDALPITEPGVYQKTHSRMSKDHRAT